MPGQLRGKVAIVTGGSRGIGKAICLALAEAGAAVSLTYKERQQVASEVVEQIISKGGQAIALQMEVRDRKSVSQAVATTEARLGGLDILVNNAGMNKPTDFDRIREEDWDEILAVNLKGPFISAQEVLPAMKRRGGGVSLILGRSVGSMGDREQPITRQAKQG